MELDQYLTVLACHKGTLMGDAQAGKKVSMARDMALVWRLKKFAGEIEHDSSVINSGVGLMILNLVCHLQVVKGKSLLDKPVTRPDHPMVTSVDLTLAGRPPTGGKFPETS